MMRIHGQIVGATLFDEKTTVVVHSLDALIEFKDGSQADRGRRNTGIMPLAVIGAG